MSEFMTIQAFSERTGISKSALRYYESLNLLRSVGRTSSGYRVYSNDQVSIIKMISSLRVADVPIKDIQVFLREEDANNRNKMMENWIQILKKKQEVLNISLRYLESDYTSDQIYLIEKKAEKIIWFSAESEVGKFRGHISKRMKELEILNIPIKSCYLKYLSGKNLIKAQIGFGVPIDIQINKLNEIELIEHMDPCICIALSFKDPIMEIQNGYRKLLNYASEHKWIPKGPILEWYRSEDFTDLDLIMPVTQMEKKGIL